MKMLRYYFISKDLDDLERFEVELEQQGISTEQIHCLSLDDTSAENHLIRAFESSCPRPRRHSQSV